LRVRDKLCQGGPPSPLSKSILGYLLAGMTRIVDGSSLPADQPEGNNGLNGCDLNKVRAIASRLFPYLQLVARSELRRQLIELEEGGFK
jgi:hypothetical protein